MKIRDIWLCLKKVSETCSVAKIMMTLFLKFGPKIRREFYRTYFSGYSKHLAVMLQFYLI